MDFQLLRFHASSRALHSSYVSGAQSLGDMAIPRSHQRPTDLESRYSRLDKVVIVIAPIYNNFRKPSIFYSQKFQPVHEP